MQANCTCLSTHSRPRVFIAGIVLSALVLFVCVLADGLSRACKDVIAVKFNWLALALDFVGGIVLYSVSSCGCSLCCACAKGGPCNRTAQASLAIGFSIVFWLFSLGILILTGIATEFYAADDEILSMDKLSTEYQALMCEERNWDRAPGDANGLKTIGGLLAAAAFILQSRFITLVPEAYANLISSSGLAAPMGLAMVAPQVIVVPNAIHPADNPSTLLPQ